MMNTAPAIFASTALKSVNDATASPPSFTLSRQKYQAHYSPIFMQHYTRQMIEKIIEGCTLHGFVWPEYNLKQLIKHIPDNSVRDIVYSRVEDAYWSWINNNFGECISSLKKSISVLK